jgi:hypothetical protein
MRAYLTCQANRNSTGHLIGTEPFCFDEKLLIKGQRLVIEF